jgi:single-strand DNA-binding protein
MARGLNKVIIMGNLGADPEVRYMPSGAAVTNIRVATSDIWKDRQTGERQERTEWHRIVLFNRIGEIAAQYLRKGSRVLVEGSLRTNKWQDQNGTERYTTEIIANSMQLMDSKAGSGFESANEMSQEAPMGVGSDTSVRQPTAQTAPVAAGAVEEEFDDDIPF